MNTKSTPISASKMTAFYPSLFQLAGGMRLVLMYGTDNEVHQYLPPPAAGTMLVMIAMDVTNAVDVKSSSRAPLCGRTTDTITFDNQGNTIILIASDDLTTWVPLNLDVTVR